MPVNGIGNTTTGRSTAAIADARFVIQATTSTAALHSVTAASASTSPTLGISMNAADDESQNVGVRIDGIATLEVNGASSNIAVNDPLVPTTGGVGIKASASGETAQWIGAIALEPATTDGALITVKIVQFEREDD